MNQRNLFVSIIACLLSSSSVQGAEPGFTLPALESQSPREVILRAMSPRDLAVTFSINNRPLGYLNKPAELKQSQEQVEEAIKAGRESESGKKSLAAALDCAAVLYYRKGEYAESNTCLEESLSIKKELGDPFELAVSYELLGMLARARAQFDKAESYYLELMQIKEKNAEPNSLELARTYSEMANLYYDANSRAKAAAYEQKAKTIIDLNKQVGRDFEQSIAPVSLPTNSSPSNLPLLKQVASSITSAAALAEAEANAEKEALRTLQSGTVPSHPKEVFVEPSRSRRSTVGIDDNELEKRRLEVMKKDLELRQQEQRAAEIQREREASERRYRQRIADEDALHESAERSRIMMEDEQARLQRQREAAGTGTSYMSRYGR
ncbi:MAG: tetratricopeptide repeat protein [Candidatus Obscuribacterales bacterium]|nr:tetratricopeptide repeat protein [Candidatus Obscuribacterales bacterium]